MSLGTPSLSSGLPSLTPPHPNLSKGCLQEINFIKDVRKFSELKITHFNNWQGTQLLNLFSNGLAERFLKSYLINKSAATGLGLGVSATVYVGARRFGHKGYMPLCPSNYGGPPSKM